MLTKIIELANSVVSSYVNDTTDFNDYFMTFYNVEKCYLKYESIDYKPVKDRWLDMFEDYSSSAVYCYVWHKSRNLIINHTIAFSSQKNDGKAMEAAEKASKRFLKEFKKMA